MNTDIMETLIIKAKKSHNVAYPDDYRIVFVEGEKVLGFVNYLKGLGDLAPRHYCDSPRSVDSEIVGFVRHKEPNLSNLFEIVEDYSFISETDMREWKKYFGLVE